MDKEAHAHREHDQHIQKLLCGGTALRHAVGDRVADNQADQGGDQAVADGAQERRQVQRKIFQILQRKTAGGGVGQGVIANHTQRDQCKDQHPKDVRSTEQECFILLHRQHPP